MTFHDQEGGHTFHRGVVFPLESCTTCSGKCPAPQACCTPEDCMECNEGRSCPHPNYGSILGLAVALLGVLAAFAIVYFGSAT